MPKKILITGGAGFIAFHLSKKLNQLGYSVTGFDNFNDYYDPGLKYARAKELLEYGIEVLTADLNDKRTLQNVISFVQPDLIIHLAATAGVRHSMDHAAEYIQNNIVGTQNLIDVAVEQGVEKAIYASTSCVMAGNPLPWKEDEPTGHQKNPYGYSKMTNENQFMSSKLGQTIGLRFFTVYGPWGRPDMALFSFSDALVKGKTIDLYNFGDMKRDFTYVDDIVQGIVLVAERALNIDNPLHEIYNIGYGQQVNLVDFVSEIEKNFGRTVEKNYLPLHPADTQETWSDTTKLQKLGYKPTTPISVGVEKFVQWYKSYYGVN